MLQDLVPDSWLEPNLLHEASARYRGQKFLNRVLAVGVLIGLCCTVSAWEGCDEKRLAHWLGFPLRHGLW